MCAQQEFLRVSGRDEDIVWRKGTSTSGGSDTVGEDLVTGLLEIGVGEDEADVACALVNAIFCSCANLQTHP